MTSRGLRHSALVTAIQRLWHAGHIHWSLWVFALAFVVRIGWLFLVNPDPFDGEYFSRGFYDAVFYYGSAQSLAAGEGFREPDFQQFSATFAPGYPLALAAVFTAFGDSLAVAKLFNVFLSAIGAVLVYIIGTRVAGQRVGIVAGLLTAFFPSHVYFSTLLMTGTFFTTLSALLVLLLIVWPANGNGLSRWQVLTLGLLVGFISLVRTEALLLVLAVPALWRLCGLPWRRIALYAPLLTVAAIVAVAPWTVRNYARFDDFIPIRQGSDSPMQLLRRGLSPDYDDRTKYEFFRVEPRGFDELAAYYASHPWRIATLPMEKTRDFFQSDSPIGWIQADYDPAPLSPGQEAGWTYLANWYYYIVGVGALLGAPFWLSRRHRGLVVVLWFIAAWSFIHLMFVPNTRYHFAIIPLLSILAGTAAVGAWERLPQTRASAMRLLGVLQT